jgi:broad specificity phosphatase PhoE
MGAIYLVRHGQASFGAADYDRLSTHGEAQAQTLGRSMQARGIKPAVLVSGGLRRQRVTAEHLARGAGWSLRPSVDVRWDEFQLGAGIDTPGAVVGADNEAYQAVLEAGMRRWELDDAGAESAREFDERSQRGLADVASSLGTGEDAVVVTSAGVISKIATSLLGSGTESWILLNRVCVNTGVTTLVNGRRGLSLLSFNEHSHLERADVTYR